MIFDLTKNKIIGILTTKNPPTMKCYYNSELDKDLIITENCKPGVFMWTNKQTGYRYIGSSINMSKYLAKFYQDRFLSVNYDCFKVGKDILLYGHSQFSLSILMYIDRGFETTKELQKRIQLERDKLIKLLKPEYNTSNKINKLLRSRKGSIPKGKGLL